MSRNVVYYLRSVVYQVEKMLFTCPPSELAAFISERLAFSGRKGLTLSELWSSVSEKLGQTAIDNFQKAIVWKWMLHSGQSTQFSLERDGSQVSNVLSYNDLFSNGHSEDDLVAFPTEEIQWEHLTHQRFSKRLKLQLGEFPFQLLCEIASHGRSGIFASDLAKLTGQDPRSMTPRLRKLEESGYIFRRSIYNEAASQHTSLCIHINFAGTEIESAATDFDEDFESTRNVYKLKQHIMQSLKTAPNELRGFKDLKMELNLHKDRSSSKFFRGIVEALHKRGYAERVFVKSLEQQTPIYCIRYIKDLPKDIAEISDFVDLPHSMKEENQEDIEDCLDVFPYINPHFPLTNQIVLCIAHSSDPGLSSMKLLRTLTGTSDFKPMVKFLDVFSTHFITSDKKKMLKHIPDPFNIMSISRAYDFEGKFKFYRYFLETNLLDAIDAHEEPAKVAANAKSLKQMNKLNFKAIGRVPPGSLLSTRKRKIPDSKANTKRIKTNSEVFSDHERRTIISGRPLSPPPKKEEASFKVSSGSSLKATRRQAELLDIVRDLGGVTYTTANLCRLLDSRLGNSSVTDKKTLARDVSALITNNSIYVENVDIVRSGQKISRKLLIIKLPGSEPSREHIEKMKQQCIDDVGSRPVAHTNRRTIDGEVYIKKSAEPGRLSSLSNVSTSLEIANLGGKELSSNPTMPSRKSKQRKRKSSRRDTEDHETKGNKAAERVQRLEGSEEDILFRAVIISKTFNRSVDFQKIASLWEGVDEKYVKQRWYALRKLLGGQSVVTTEIKKFEAIVLNAIENAIIGKEELESFNLRLFLDLWGEFEVSGSVTEEREPLFQSQAKNHRSYSFSEVPGAEPELFDLIEDSSMRQKEAMLARKTFHYPYFQKPEAQFNKAKTLIRAIIATESEKFDPRQVSNLLERFDETAIKSATTEMVKDKEIVYQENALFKFQFSEKFHTTLTHKSLGFTLFMNAAQFFESLSELGQSSKGLILSQAIAGGHMAVLLSLIASNQLELIRVDRNYRLNGYESRLIDKAKLSCDLVVYMRPLDDFKARRQTKVPSGKAGSHLWLMVDGSINVTLWKTLIAAILTTIVMSPETNDVALSKRLKPVLELDDLKCIIKWLVSNKSIRALGRGTFRAAKMWMTTLGY